MTTPNLIGNHSFENVTLAPWQKSGEVFKMADNFAFERDYVAQLDMVPGRQGIISQLVRVPTSEALSVSYALKPTVSGANGELTVMLQWYGSANAGLPLLREDILEIIREGSQLTANESDWRTHTPVSLTIPDGAIWVRLRFIESQSPGDSLKLDEVFLTA